MWKHLGQLINPQKFKQKTHIDRLIINNKTINDPQEISEEMNRYFCSVGETLAKSITNQKINYNAYMQSWVTDSVYLTPVTSEEILSEIAKLNPNKACGHDNFGPKLIQSVSDLIVEPLEHIYNLSLSKGIVPKDLKISKVIPIYKKGDTWQPGNYRPISLLPTLEKLLERMVYSRISSFIESHNIIYKNQFGFRRNHSTTLAMVDIVDGIYQNLDQNMYAMGIFLDIQKAFDSVNHEILLSKMYRYGFRGIAQQWFKSYLDDRQQYITINNHRSTLHNMKTGVPQGSVLGPLLFLLYINDIMHVLDSDRLKLFADDTNIFLFDNDLKCLAKKANEDLQALYQWFHANKLSLNIDKTCYSIFAPNNKQVFPIKLLINNNEINRVDCCKYLGVMLDEKLSWKNHIDHVYSKLLKFTSLFYKLRNNLTIECRKSLYFAMVHQQLIYAIEIYGSANKTVLHPLQTLQNKLLRILEFEDSRSPTNKLFRAFNTFKLQDLYEQSILKLAHKLIHQPSIMPQIYHNYITYNQQVHNYNTRHKNDIHVFQVRTDYGLKTFKSKCHQLWNVLPEQVKHYKSPLSFRNNLKVIYAAKYID